MESYLQWLQEYMMVARELLSSAVESIFFNFNVIDANFKYIVLRKLG